MSELVHYEVAGGVATITLDSPRNRNALSRQLVAELAASVEVAIADIGEAAGINASSVYSHFAGKADLLAAAYYRATNRLELATADALVDAGTPAQALRRLVETYVRITFDGADLAAVYVSESENLPAADRHRLRVAQRRHVDTWVGLVTELDGGEPPAAARFRVHAALNVVTDLARSRGASVTEERAVTLVAAVLHNR